MFKRVIFDIDNTLIPWKEEYYQEIRHALRELNIEYTEKDYNEILQALNEYENVYYKFNRELMLKYINEYTKKQYPNELIYNITKRYEDCVIDKIEPETIETLEYLKSKYELVILTDWFADQQIKRLEKIDISKYFSNVYSAENAKRKPFKEAFIQAIETNKPEECVMIGDNFERDIKGAINAGLQAIWYNPNKKEVEEKFKTRIFANISKLDELKEIL